MESRSRSLLLRANVRGLVALVLVPCFIANTVVAGGHHDFPAIMTGHGDLRLSVSPDCFREEALVPMATGAAQYILEATRERNAAIQHSLSTQTEPDDRLWIEILLESSHKWVHANSKSLTPPMFQAQVDELFGDINRILWILGLPQNAVSEELFWSIAKVNYYFYIHRYLREDVQLGTLWNQMRTTMVRDIAREFGLTALKLHTVWMTYHGLSARQRNSPDVGERLREKNPKQFHSLQKQIDARASVKLGQVQGRYYVSDIETDGAHQDPETRLDDMRVAVEALVLEALEPREREVIAHRFGLRDEAEKTLEEIGVLFELTRESIRQIESKALMKLRRSDGLAALDVFTTRRISEVSRVPDPPKIRAATIKADIETDRRIMQACEQIAAQRSPGRITQPMISRMAGVKGRKFHDRLLANPALAQTVEQTIGDTQGYRSAILTLLEKIGEKPRLKYKSWNSWRAGEEEVVDLYMRAGHRSELFSKMDKHDVYQREVSVLRKLTAYLRIQTLIQAGHQELAEALVVDPDGTMRDLISERLYNNLADAQIRTFGDLFAFTQKMTLSPRGYALFWSLSTLDDCLENFGLLRDEKRDVPAASVKTEPVYEPAAGPIVTGDDKGIPDGVFKVRTTRLSPITRHRQKRLPRFMFGFDEKLIARITDFLDKSDRGYTVRVLTELLDLEPSQEDMMRLIMNYLAERGEIGVLGEGYIGNRRLFYGKKENLPKNAKAFLNYRCETEITAVNILRVLEGQPPMSLALLRFRLGDWRSYNNTDLGGRLRTLAIHNKIRTVTKNGRIKYFRPSDKEWSGPIEPAAAGSVPMAAAERPEEEDSSAVPAPEKQDLRVVLPPGLTVNQERVYQFLSERPHEWLMISDVIGALELVGSRMALHQSVRSALNMLVKYGFVVSHNATKEKGKRWEYHFQGPPAPLPMINPPVEIIPKDAGVLAVGAKWYPQDLNVNIFQSWPRWAVLDWHYWLDKTSELAERSRLEIVLRVWAEAVHSDAQFLRYDLLRKFDMNTRMRDVLPIGISHHRESALSKHFGVSIQSIKKGRDSSRQSS